MNAPLFSTAAHYYNLSRRFGPRGGGRREAVPVGVTRPVHSNLGIEYFGVSDIGLRRANNQDAFAEVPAPNAQVWADRGHLFLVADGMGAHAAGELASKIAAESVPHVYGKLRELPPHLALRQSILESNSKIHEKGQANAGFHGMGTTCTALVLLPAEAIAAHVGDSRLYRLRDQKIEQLSFDHSLAWEIGAVTGRHDDALPNHIPKNIITRSLGPNPVVEVDLEGPFPLRSGDLFLLCSDGLSGQVEDREIGALLRWLPLEEAVLTLVDLAKLRGGPDNITVLAVRVVEAAVPGARSDAACGRNTSGKPWQLNPMSGFLLAGGLALALLLWLVDYALAAGAVVAATILAAAWLSWRSPQSQGLGGDLGAPPLGKAPYASHDFAADKELVTRFLDMFDAVRGAAAEALSDEELGALEAEAKLARRAVAEQQWEEALRVLARGIRRSTTSVARQTADSPHDFPA